MPTLFDLLPELAVLAVIAVAGAGILGAVQGWHEADECHASMKLEGKCAGRAWGIRSHLFDLNLLTVWTPLLFLAAALGHPLPLAVVFGPWGAHLAYYSLGHSTFDTCEWLHLRNDRREAAAP